MASIHHDTGGFAVPQPLSRPMWPGQAPPNRPPLPPSDSLRFLQGYGGPPSGQRWEGLRPGLVEGGGVSGLKRKSWNKKNNFKKKRKLEAQASQLAQSQGGWGPYLQPGGPAELGGYPRVNDLRKAHKAKTKRHFPRARPPPARPFRSTAPGFAARTKSQSTASPSGSRPHAPYNTSSFLMRSNKMGINAPLESPAMSQRATPAAMSPGLWQPSSTGDRELNVDAEALNVDPYGSMSGQIRLKSTDQNITEGDDEEVDKDDPSRSSESDLDEDSDGGEHDSVQRFEQRMDQDLQRFLYNPADSSNADGTKADGEAASLRRRLEEQEVLIGSLEEDNMNLRERLYILEQTLKEMERTGRVAEESGDSGDEASGARFSGGKPGGLEGGHTTEPVESNAGNADAMSA